MVWLVLALVIVLVVAALLIWVLLEARGIRTEAVRALMAAGQVEERTVALWKIPELNQLLATGVGILKSIAQKAKTAADTVAPEKR